MDEADEAAEVVGIRLGQDAVAEVEDVAGPAFGAAQDVLRAALDPLPWPEQDRPVEIPLDSPVVPIRSQATSSGTRQSMPITSPPTVLRSSRRCASPVAK